MGQCAEKQCCISQQGEQKVCCTPTVGRCLSTGDLSLAEGARGAAGRNGSPQKNSNSNFAAEPDTVASEPDDEYCDDPNGGDSSAANGVGPGYFERELAEFLHFVGKGSAVEEARPAHRFETGATYTGSWKGNLRHGFGVHRWPDGAEYKGQWVNNQAQGMGMFVHRNNDTYLGQWFENKAHGLGMYRHYDCVGVTLYEGEFVNDRLNGYGVESWGEGSRFQGNFRNGVKDGFGVYHWPGGAKYEGTWEGNHINGSGTYVGIDGRTFRGQWHDSRMHGNGKFEWVNGRVYSGEYVFDHKDGFGVFVWEGGQKYQGYWRQGKQHGQGNIAGASSGASVAASWEKGRRVTDKDKGAVD